MQSHIERSDREKVEKIENFPAMIAQSVMRNFRAKRYGFVRSQSLDLSCTVTSERSALLWPCDKAREIAYGERTRCWDSPSEGLHGAIEDELKAQWLV